MGRQDVRRKAVPAPPQEGRRRMIRRIRTANVGPVPDMDIALGRRLNVLTGDNGLGKSFVLDVAWWGVSRVWPGEISRRMASGRMVIPNTHDDAEIRLVLSGAGGDAELAGRFLRREFRWTDPDGDPAEAGIILYAMADGSFAVWDRNRNVASSPEDARERSPAYVFARDEVFDGLRAGNGRWICNGLIRDWAGWQKENGEQFARLRDVLAALSASGRERLLPGALTRVALDDARDIPTIRMPWGQDVAAVHVSAGMRRILSLAYLLVWEWGEHCRVSGQTGMPVAERLTFLIDEVEAHLHPGWQRSIVRSLLNVVKCLSKAVDVQIVMTTHSPLIMASLEPIFDPGTDAWFDFDLKRKRVRLDRRMFEKRGDAGGWLVSEAFDLGSGRPLEYEKLVGRAAELLYGERVSADRILKMHKQLVAALGERDPFLLRWRALCERRRLL